MNKSTIILVDDHPMLRKGVLQLIALEERLEVIAEANTGEEAIALATRHQPDLILLDLNMKGMSGIETLSALKCADIESKIVMFTVSDSEVDVLQALKSGADGYLLKDCEPEELIEKLYLALSGELVVSEPLTQIVIRSLRHSVTSVNPIEKLTLREIEILRLIVGGKSNKAIARYLNITEGTVKVHVKNLLKKLALRTRVEAAVWAVKNKLSVKR